MIDVFLVVAIFWSWNSHFHFHNHTNTRVQRNDVRNNRSTYPSPTLDQATQHPSHLSHPSHLRLQPRLQSVYNPAASHELNPTRRTLIERGDSTTSAQHLTSESPNLINQLEPWRNELQPSTAIARKFWQADHATKINVWKKKIPSLIINSYCYNSM